MGTLLLVAVLVGVLALLGLAAMLLRQVSAIAQVDVKREVAGQVEILNGSLGQKFSSATADMASRLEQTKGDLRQQVADRLGDGFSGLRTVVEGQMKAGRQEQSERLAETRAELAGALAMTTSALKSEFDRLNQ